MRIRLTGTTAEIDRIVTVLREVLDVVDESPHYLCRPPSRLVRVYLEIHLPTTGGGDGS